VVNGSNVELTLPDYSQAFSEQTRWSRNYLHWYITTTSQSGGGFFPILGQTRTQVGQAAFKLVIDDVNPDLPLGGHENNVLFGLAVLHGDNGGYVIEPITTDNKVQLSQTIDALDATGSTPIGEALVDMGRYFVGEHQNLGTYPAYDRDMLTGAATLTPPLSPIDTSLTCQTNFVVLMTDGQPTNDGNNHYGSAFSTTIGDWDGDSNDNGGDDWLDDAAGYLANTDLIDDAIMAGQQSIVTYTIGFSIDLPLLQEAATNGSGVYYQTSSAPALAVQLKQALSSIIARAQTFTTASVPSSRSQFGDGFYTGFFEPREDESFWPGHLEAYRIDQNFELLGKADQPALDPNTGDFFDPRRPIWDVAHKLAGTNGEPAHPARNLFTTATGARIDFNAANLTDVDLSVTGADLGVYPNDPNTPFATTEALADAVVAYVSGEDAFDLDRDADVTETRVEVLGDIFHSRPIVVGTPPPFLLGEQGFGPPQDPNSHFGRFARRDRKLYVGANDGMLHGINAGVLINGPNGLQLDHAEAVKGGSGGEEAFGFVPSFLLPKLKQLPIQSLNNKSFYVDGSPAVADAWLSSGINDVSKESSEWTTVLMTGMRRGGDGYLALDVSDPEASGGTHGPYPRLLWEFYDPAEPLGETWSQPVITRVRLQGGPGGDFCDSFTSPPPDCKEQWVAIFAGGYREDGDAALAAFAPPGNPAFTTGGKAIYVVAIETGQVLARVAYDPADPVLSSMTYALPTDPAVVDLDFDGFADVIYAGDTGGQMWKWDISEIGQPDPSGMVTNWPVGVFFRTPIASNGHHRGLYFPPVLSFVDGRMLLAFGTGERTDITTVGDPAVDDENRLYVVEDLIPVGAGSIPATAYTEADVTQLNGVLQDPDPTDLGFYVVAEEGEKFITNHLAFAGFLITTSFKPLTGTGACATGGEAFLYVLDLGTGGGFFGDQTTPPDLTRRLALGGGVPTDPSITTSTAGGSGSRILVQTSDGSVTNLDGPDDGLEPVKMVFWRQQL
jgi:type IV pilus assembly protein PilY1